MADLVYIGIDRDGLERARADQRDYAAKLARDLTDSSMVIEDILTEEVLEAVQEIQCIPWPVKGNV